MGPQKRFRPEQRIRRQETFKQLIEKGRFFRGSCFYLWVDASCKDREKKAPGKPMLGVAVSRKTEPSAVGRNLWKRRIREIFREKQTELLPGAMYLVKVRQSQARKPFSEIAEELVGLFRKAGTKP